MTSPFDGSSIDGSGYLDVVRLAQHSPSWLDDLVLFWSTYGLAFFAVLAAVGWWRARRVGPAAATEALTIPAVVIAAYGADSALKLVVREDRPCQSLHVKVLEACPAPGDWSFPSNHAAIAAAAAAALLFVSRRLSAIGAVAALAMAAARVWVGAHYPHDIVAGIAVGALTGLLLMNVVRRRSEALARWITSGRLRPLLIAPQTNRPSPAQPAA
ncbi:phosphatase PAP2 family protein [Streptomyces sp. NPDC046931]|uniref:phosphatase PAP2 family protein n=1 Tax=Streptomyces sp. NPDC046931 TaxID=3154806 RepID=UPI00340F802F